MPVSIRTVLASIAISAATASAQPCLNQPFAGQHSMAIEDEGNAIRFGDLDGDGDHDMVYHTGIAPATAVYIRFNQGGGVFGPSVTLGEFSDNIADLEMGDMDGDGDLDLVIGFRMTLGLDHVLLMMLNDGAGAFPFSAPFNVETIDLIELGDLDGDGDLNVAVMLGAEYGVLLNIGGGKLSSLSVVYPIVGGAIDFSLADVDTDGDLDAIYSSATGLTVRLNNGSAGFAFSSLIPVSGSPSAHAIGDFDADGDPDVALALDLERIVLYFNNGAGVLTEGPTFDAFDSPLDLVAADLNGDGSLDLATNTFFSSDVSLFFNDGSGSFGPQVSVPTPPEPFWLEAADLDADGVADIGIVHSAGQRLTVLLGTGTGEFSDAVTHGTGPSPGALAVGSLNGNGDPVVVVANRDDNSISVFLGAAPLSLVPVGLVNLPGVDPRDVDLADVNNDGDLDLIVTFSAGGGEISVLLGDGAGGFAPPYRYTNITGARSSVVADIDGDSDPDIIVACDSTQRVHVLVNRDLYTSDFSEQFFFSGTGALPTSVAVGDINADTLPDILTANEGDATVSLFINQGDGSFVAADPIPAGNSPRDIALADLDQDGDLDAVVANTSNNEISILLNDASGSFPVRNTLPAGSEPESVAIGDVDGDALPDIIITNHDSGDTSLYRSLGGGAFRAERRLLGAQDATDVALIDLGPDGDLDILITASDGDLISIIPNVCIAEQNPCPADLAEPFGVLDFSDVLAFLTAFGSSDPAADLADPIGTFDFSDVLAFLGAFGAGCP